jgi:hypothetical protein
MDMLYSRHGRFKTEENLLPLPGYETRVIHLTTLWLHRLRYSASYFVIISETAEKLIHGSMQITRSNKSI